MTSTLTPDPSVIGGVPQAPLAFLPDPKTLFATRARRFAFLAGTGGHLAPYLRFLAELTDLQARLATTMDPATPLPRDRIDLARSSRMPPIDRARLAADPALHATLDLVGTHAAGIEMPQQARLALKAIADADLSDRHWLLDNILSDQIPDDAVAPHLFVAAAVQLHLARLAATLRVADLVAIRTGVCPSCGGRPVTSSVMGADGIESIRYAACNACATRWNEVRVKCLCCGENGKISYRSVETDAATVKAELCGDCHSWVKILYQVQNHSLDPVADDVFSLGLDLLMRDTDYTRAGVNPYLAGY